MKLRLGQAEIDLSTRTVVVGGHARRLAPKPAEVLRVLIEARGDVVGRDLLLGRVWPHVYVGEEVLTQSIAELRRAFCDNARQPAYIETISKAGYRLLPAISCLPAEDPHLPGVRGLAGDETVEALQHYLQAVELFEMGGEWNVGEVRTLTERAIECDGSFAPARALLATAMAWQRLYFGVDDDGLRNAAETAELAVAIDPSTPEAHAARGFIQASRGDWKEGVRSFNQAMRLSTDTYLVLFLFGRALFAHGDYAAASSVFNHAGRLRGEEYHTVFLSANALSSGGTPEAAVSLYRRAAFRAEQVILDRPDEVRARACAFCSRIGEHGLEGTESLLEAIGTDYDPVTYYVWSALARAGETDFALDWLEEVIDRGWSDPAFMAHDSAYGLLAGEPRFRRMAGAIAAI